MLAVALQMAWGSSRAWLPEFLTRRTVSADQFRTMMNWIIPKLQKVEGWIRPRYWPFWRRQGDRIVGVLSVVLAISVVLPIPGGNWFPAFSATLLGLALLERDGILFAIGSFIGAASIAWVCTIVAGATFAAKWAAAYMHWF